MELNITNFFNNAAPMDYSASVAEIGRNAGADTWQAALDDSVDYPLLSSDNEREEVRRYFKGFGAWSETEIAAWTDTELNALLIQFIAGSIRESGLTPDSSTDEWSVYEADENGPHDIFRAEDGQIYFYVGG